MELTDLQYNGTVQLKSDAEFRGFIIGQCVPDDPLLGVMIVIGVSKPGSTFRHGNVLMPLSDLAPAPAAAANGRRR